MIALQVCVAAGLAWLGLRMLLVEGLQVNSLAQIQRFAAAVLAPAFALWCLQRAFAGRARVQEDQLLIDTAGRQLQLPLSAIASAQAWRLPAPDAGVHLCTQAGETLDFATASPSAVLAALSDPDAQTAHEAATPGLLQVAAEQRARSRHRVLDAAWLKLGLFPLLPALVAFHLHQFIVYGGAFGEWQSFGFTAWASGLLLWWASWVFGLTLFAALLRLLVEACALLALSMSRLLRFRPAARDASAPLAPVESRLRSGLEWTARAIYYLGVPAWLLMRVM
jgi:apolipoprotein N-acyltransferase